MSNTKTFGKSNPKSTGPSMTVKSETAANIGLFGAVLVIISAVVGCGIFFKNKSVMKFNNGNGMGVLLGWIIAFIIAFSTAYSYGEITRCKTKSENTGLAGWAERYVGYRFGRFLKIMYPLFYFGVYLLAIGIFSAEALLNTNPQWGGEQAGIVFNQKFGFWIVILISVVMVFSLLLINYLSDKLGNKITKSLALIKFVPIGLVLIAGIIAGCLFPENNLFKSCPNQFGDGKLDFFGVISSLPGILFAFDSFLIVGNVAKHVKNPVRNIPLSIVVSMITTGAINILITVSQIVSGTGDPYSLVNELCKNNANVQTSMKVLVSILIFCSIFGVLNSFIFAATNAIQSTIDEEVLIGYRWLKKISNGKCKNFGGIIYSSILMFIYLLAIGIPSIFLDTDAIVDGLTNATTLLMFLIYGMVAFMSIVNRKTQKVPVTEVRYQKGQCVAASISSIGCWSITGFCLIKEFLFDAIKSGDQIFKSWGLFYNTEHAAMYKWEASVWFWCFTISFFIIPFAHDLIMKLIYKDYKQPFVWQKTNIKFDPIITSR